MYAKFLLLAAFLFVLSVPFAISLQITEIMHNPSGSDTGREWVEIYNNDSSAHNITGWKLNTDGIDHSFNVPPSNGGQGSMVIQPGGFAVIVQNASLFLVDYPGHNGTVIDSSWSDLSNSQNKTIWIKNSTIIFDNVTYSLAGEGNSSCIINNSFNSCPPTPGAANVLNGSAGNSSTQTADATLGFLVNNSLVNSTYTIFRANITGKDCARLDNITLAYNITPGASSSLSAEISCAASLASWTPSSAGNYTICGSINNVSFADTNASNNEGCRTVVVIGSAKQCNTSVSILSDSVVNSSVTLEYKLLLSDSACNESSVEVEYWIEDLFGSYMKAKLNTTQEFSCSKTVGRQWTPDSMTGTEAYKIKAVLRTSCPDNNSDNYAEKLIVVRGSQAVASVAPSSSSSVSSSSSSTGIAANSSTISKKSLELISYPPKVHVDEPFEIVVNVSVSNFSIYSYVYSGNNPVSRSLDGKATWDANRKELNASGLVILAKKIENGTLPGTYTMKVRLKSDKEEDIARIIEVLERPKLSIEKINSSFLITACEGCEMMILGQDFEFSGRNYTLETPGVFHLLLIKDSKIFSKELIKLDKIPVQENKIGITGMAVKKSGRIGGSQLLILNALLKIRLF